MTKMGRKAFHVTMDEKGYEQLNFRASQLPISKGEFVEFLLSSLELRMESIYKQTGLKKNYQRDRRIVELLFFVDLHSPDPIDWISELEVKSEWTPVLPGMNTPPLTDWSKSKQLAAINKEILERNES